MNFKQACIQSCGEVLSMFGFRAEYANETNEKSLTSGKQVSIIIGFTNGLKGNAVIGASREAALKIVSGMMGGIQIMEFDLMAKSALGELANILIGSAVTKLQSDLTIELSPPTLAIGDNMFLMISRITSTKLCFRMDDEIFNIIFCIE